MKILSAAKKQKQAELTRLRELRKSYLDKARECVVYGDAKGYRFWIDSANQIIGQIEKINWPEGPGTERRIREGELIITLRKRLSDEV